MRLSKSDIGKVIGKRGRTAGAIRTIINAVSTKQGKRAELEIVE
ncbi:MAG TPA: KH domain-containing protein [Candidatus Syntrophosphaera sp.]|nr:KH domain-containing protein [Candidatus Syntrophosphaera sp.]